MDNKTNKEANVKPTIPATAMNSGGYVNGDEILTEVIVDEELLDDDNASVWTDAPMEDDVEEVLDVDMEDVEHEGRVVVDDSLAVFTGHGKESVYCVASHPLDCGVFMTGGGDDRAFIWRFDAQLPGVPDEPSLASGSTGTPRPESSASNRHMNALSSPPPVTNTAQSNECSEYKVTQLATLAGHMDTITSVGFNFDGTLCLTGAYDGEVRIWDASTGELRQVLQGPEDVEFAHWHSKGNAVVAGSKDGTVWLWLAHNGQCLQVLAGHDGPVTCGDFSRDGKAIITGGEDGTLRIWSPKTGVCRHVFSDHEGHAGTVTCIDSSDDGDTMLSGSVDGRVLFLHVTNKKLLHQFQHCAPTLSEETGELEALSVECVGFCKLTSVKWAASGGADGYLKVWDLVSGALRIACSHNSNSVVALQWHQSAQHILVTAALDHLLRVWDVRDGACLRTLSGHNDMLISLSVRALDHPFAAASPHGSVDTLIVGVSDDGTARVFPFNASEIRTNA